MMSGDKKDGTFGSGLTVTGLLVLLYLHESLSKLLGFVSGLSLKKSLGV